jgi:hypothetical protein
MNNQVAHGDSYNGTGVATLDQEILNSDAFKAWLVEKSVRERVAFYNKEHALHAYLNELVHGAPFPAFLFQTNDLGMLSVHSRPLPSARGLVITITDL